MLKKLIGLAGALFLASMPLSAQEYVLDKTHAHVTFEAKHMMISKVKGEFSDYDIKVVYDERSKKLLALEGVVRVNSINTKNEKRDSHLKSNDFFNVAQYPEMRFRMTRFVPEDSYHVVAGDAHGELTIRGVTRPAVFEVEIKGPVVDMNGKKRLGFEIGGNISRRDFGLTWNKVLESGGVAIGDEIDIEIDFEAVQK